MTKLLGSWDPVVLGMLVYLGVGLILGVVGVAVELAPKFCSGHGPRLEGTLSLTKQSSWVPGS